MTSIVPRSSMFPDLIRLMETFPFTDRHMVRVEDYFDDGRYVVRAEMPGLDAEKDIEISVANGELTIAAQRSEEKHTKSHTEFHYGSYGRTVTLPKGADSDHIKAGYDAGILTVEVPIKKVPEARQVPVSTTKK
ncbi:Hsp20/alpha crystallin family protein [Actinokineospora xionganensis]|uniref:Hsp20/alpha crystallin family protein n=1 Tax=Actinokineospora xionganensis TaxID=2684470 RepID=A0ABR7KZI3_9PSEU|nr:Hsp20/alpha crystallin family protein [Actinokineospora xionganensis]MBC6445841.1 Hsp20/alpha crystallin family protein [Actinokineospora xionganensis]